MMHRRAFALGLAGLTTLAAHPSLAQTADPRSVGLSPEGLKALNAAMHAPVDQQKLAGVVTLVARKGRIAHLDAYGKADLTTGAAVTPTSIFRIASMTKPIAGVAMMMLWEEGKWKLDDPVAKHIPEFANLQVKTSAGGTEPQKSPMTMAQLMSHSAGFDVSAGYESANLRAGDLQAMINTLAKLPLAAQPGSDWRYGPSVDIQGYLIQKLSGQPLDVFLERRLFNPLKMRDTGFWVAPEKAARVVRVNTYDGAGKITPAPVGADPTKKPVFLSASGGLLSTAPDYFRFCQMLLNRGELDGVRLLKPATVEVLRTNVLQPGVKVDLYGPSQEGVGFGMGVAVLMDRAAAKTPRANGSYWWGGAFGTWFWIDPANELIVIGMIQNLNGSTPGRGTPELRETSASLVYAALTDAKA